MISTRIRKPTNTPLYRRQIALPQPEFDGRLTSRSGEDVNAISGAVIDGKGTIRSVSVKEGMKEICQK